MQWKKREQNERRRRTEIQNLWWYLQSLNWYCKRLFLTTVNLENNIKTASLNNKQLKNEAGWVRMVLVYFNYLIRFFLIFNGGAFSPKTSQKRFYHADSHSKPFQLVASLNSFPLKRRRCRHQSTAVTNSSPSTKTIKTCRKSPAVSNLPVITYNPQVSTDSLVRYKLFRCSISIG